MNQFKSCWDILEIEHTTNKRDIKRAYAKKAKTVHPEEHPEAFQELRRAYDTALRIASYSGERTEIFKEPDYTQPEQLEDVQDNKHASVKTTLFDFGKLTENGLEFDQYHENVEYLNAYFRRVSSRNAPILNDLVYEEMFKRLIDDRNSVLYLLNKLDEFLFENPFVYSSSIELPFVSVNVRWETDEEISNESNRVFNAHRKPTMLMFFRSIYKKSIQKNIFFRKEVVSKKSVSRRIFVLSVAYLLCWTIIIRPIFLNFPLNQVNSYSNALKNSNFSYELLHDIGVETFQIVFDSDQNVNIAYSIDNDDVVEIHTQHVKQEEIEPLFNTEAYSISAFQINGTTLFAERHMIIRYSDHAYAFGVLDSEDYRRLQNEIVNDSKNIKKNDSWIQQRLSFEVRYPNDGETMKLFNQSLVLPYSIGQFSTILDSIRADIRDVKDIFISYDSDDARTSFTGTLPNGFPIRGTINPETYHVSQIIIENIETLDTELLWDISRTIVPIETLGYMSEKIETIENDIKMDENQGIRSDYVFSHMLIKMIFSPQEHSLTINLLNK